MADQFVTTRDTISGVVGVVPKSYLDHPVLGKNLEEVKDDAKDLNQDLHKPRAARKKSSEKPDETPKVAGDQPFVTSDPETR